MPTTEITGTTEKILMFCLGVLGVLGGDRQTETAWTPPRTTIISDRTRQDAARAGLATSDFEGFSTGLPVPVAGNIPTIGRPDVGV